MEDKEKELEEQYQAGLEDGLRLAIQILQEQLQIIENKKHELYN